MQKFLFPLFQSFFHINLKKYFDTIHFLPFYPSSSDSGFAVKDHYKIEKKLVESTYNQENSKRFIIAMKQKLQT